MSSSEIKFEAHNKLVRDVLFGHDHFRIPEYQRPYSWTVDNVNDFWTDLQNSDGGHFIGSFVLNYENYATNKYVDIIDGQQRILTITIFLAVIRDIMKSFEDKDFYDLASSIQNDYIAKDDKIDDILTYRVIVGDSTRGFFESYIQSGEYVLYNEIRNFGRLPKEHRCIKENYVFLYDRIKDEIDKINSIVDKLEYLKGLVRKLKELSIIRIKIEKEVDAYVIFETVNDRGVDLTAADLVKNKIFHYHDKKFGKVDDAKSAWGHIMENVEGIDDINSFLKYYLSSKYGYLNKKSILRKIEEKVSNYKDFLIDLKAASLHYRMILNAQDEYSFDMWDEPEIVDYNDKRYDCYLSAVALQNMKIKQFTIVILSLLRNWQEVNKFCRPNRVFEAMEKFAFNFFTLAKLPARDIEVLCCVTAVSIETAISKNLSQEEGVSELNRIFDGFINKLKSLLPESNDTFYEGFKYISYKNKDLCRYILVKINKYIQPNAEIDYASINLEHILPRNPSTEWNLTAEDIEDYVHMLGNLTILGSTINKQIGNKTLEYKLPAIEERSVLKLAQDLVKKIKENNLKRDKEEIIKRQSELASLAIESVRKLK